MRFLKIGAFALTVSSLLGCAVTSPIPAVAVSQSNDEQLNCSELQAQIQSLDRQQEAIKAVRRERYSGFFTVFHLPFVAAAENHEYVTEENIKKRRVSLLQMSAEKKCKLVQ